MSINSRHSLNSQSNTFIMAKWKMRIERDLESKAGQVELFMKDNGLIISKVEKVAILTKKGTYMKAISN